MRNKWLVEVCLSSDTERLVRHFYVVDGADSGEQARSAIRGGAEVPGEPASEGTHCRWGTVQQILLDPLGCVVLS